MEDSSGETASSLFHVSVVVAVSILFLIITLTIASYCSTRSRQMRLRSNQDPTIEGGPVSSTVVVMEEAVLERFPKVLYSEAKLIRNELGNNNYSTCSVCLGDYRESDEVRILLPGCGHAFHLNCVDSWLRLRPTCPLCRHQLHSLSASPI